MLAPEGELARANAHCEPPLCLRVQLAEAMDDDRAVLGEAIADIQR
jgi:hypothetical protein